MGGRFHPRLNINTRPIANKYHEGKVKRTLKRGLKVHETVMGEANAAVVFMQIWFVCCFGGKPHHICVSSVGCRVEIRRKVSSHLREK
jgi:hypothetical protein